MQPTLGSPDGKASQHVPPRHLRCRNLTVVFLGSLRVVFSFSFQGRWGQSLAANLHPISAVGKSAGQSYWLSQSLTPLVIRQESVLKRLPLPAKPHGSTARENRRASVRPQKSSCGEAVTGVGCKLPAWILCQVHTRSHACKGAHKLRATPSWQLELSKRIRHRTVQHAFVTINEYQRYRVKCCHMWFQVNQSFQLIWQFMLYEPAKLP